MTYIEVWSPHDDYADLVRLVDAARDRRPERPVVLAAYLAPFAEGSGPDQVAAAKLALATVWSAGGQYLLFGERHGALTHPYYPNYATLGDEAVAVLRRFADFAVANGDLLFDPTVTRSTRHLWLGVNEDVVVDGAPVSPSPRPAPSGCASPRPGSAWSSPWSTCAVSRTRAGTSRSGPPARPPESASGFGSPRRSRRHGSATRWPDRSSRTLDVTVDGDYLELEVPEFDTWAVVARRPLRHRQTRRSSSPVSTS